MEIPKSVFILLFLSLKFLKGLCIRTMTDGKKVIRSPELCQFIVPVSSALTQGSLGLETQNRPPFPLNPNHPFSALLLAADPKAVRTVELTAPS